MVELEPSGFKVCIFFSVSNICIVKQEIQGVEQVAEQGLEPRSTNKYK